VTSLRYWADHLGRMKNGENLTKNCDIIQCLSCFLSMNPDAYWLLDMAFLLSYSYLLAELYLSDYWLT